VLLFNATRARWVATEVWHPQQDGKLQLDGGYLLRLPYSREPELVMDILKYGAFGAALMSILDVSVDKWQIDHARTHRNAGGDSGAESACL